jgi:hypothetical protein
MDDNDTVILISLAFAAAAHQLLYSYNMFYDDIPTPEGFLKTIIKTID